MITESRTSLATDVMINQHLPDDVRRQRLFDGTILLVSCGEASRKVSDYGLELLSEHFATHDPSTAYRSLPVSEFIRCTENVKNVYSNGLRIKELLRAMMIAQGIPVKDYFCSLPRIRIVPFYDYLHAGVSYAYRPHRDTWYGAPEYQINYWMPIADVLPEQAMEMYPWYFSRTIENSSNDFDLERWITVDRKDAVANDEIERRKHPLPLQEIDKSRAMRFAGCAGDAMIFSGHHLHATVPNFTKRTRYSTDFRLYHIDDIQGTAAGHVTPPTNLDCGAKNRGFAFDELFRLSDFEPFRTCGVL